MSRTDPRARDRVIGAMLRAVRTTRINITLEKAAALAEWSPPRLSRTERGQRRTTTEEVAVLLTAWGVPGGEREKILTGIRADVSSGWWDRPLPGIPAEIGALASYEKDANELVDVSASHIPALLQTYDTAVGVMLADGVLPADIPARLAARQRRQQGLGRLDYTAFIGEAALLSPFGGPVALRAQLAHLLACQDRAMRIRVVPLHQTRVLLDHSWLWMGFPSADPVVHVDLMPAAFYVHNHDVQPYTHALQRLGKAALSQADSRTRIAQIMRRSSGSTS